MHAKAGFKDNIKYDLKNGFSISQKYMKDKGWSHKAMTKKQRELFKELHKSGRANTLAEHSRIAEEALVAGGATSKEAKKLVKESFDSLKKEGVHEPSNIPWYK